MLCTGAGWLFDDQRGELPVDEVVHHRDVDAIAVVGPERVVAVLDAHVADDGVGEADAKERQPGFQIFLTEFNNT